VHPKGNNITTHMAVYLHWNDAAFTPPELNPTISYTVTLVNQQDRSKDIKRAVICFAAAGHTALRPAAAHALIPAYIHLAVSSLPVVCHVKT
jgi:hypothetical protein